MPFVSQPKETCTGCAKTVYATEKIVVENSKNESRVFHKSCLRCATCNKVLSLGNYSSIEDKFLCKPHFKQLFLSKGNYDEAFGVEKAKDKFAAPPVPVGLAPASFVPVAKDEHKKASAEPVATSEETAAKFRKFREQSDAEKCDACSKSVYAAERLVVADKKVQKLFHKTCFKCVTCSLTLDLRNFGFFDQKAYCQNHLKEVSQKSTVGGSGASEESKGVDSAPVGAVRQNSFVRQDSSTALSRPPLKSSGSDGAFKTSDETAAKFRKFREQSDAEKCQSCGKTVYFSEKLVVDDRQTPRLFHKGCFKCSTCSINVDLRNFGMVDQKVYCKTHLKEANAAKLESTAKTAAVPTGPVSFVPAPTSEKVPEKGETPAHVAARFKGVGGSTDKCKVCSKTVYATERLVFDDFKTNSQTIFHKSCLKCSFCNIQLDLANFGSSEGKIYCQTHLKQLAKPAQAKDNAFFISPLHQGTDYVPQHEDGTPMNSGDGEGRQQRDEEVPQPTAGRDEAPAAAAAATEQGESDKDEQSNGRAQEEEAGEGEKAVEETPAEDAASQEETPPAEDESKPEPAAAADEQSDEDRAAERDRRRAEREAQRKAEEEAEELERAERRRRRDEERAARAAADSEAQE